MTMPKIKTTAKAAAQMKCRTCGGHCGKKRGQSCQYGKNDEKRRASELFAACFGMGRKA